MILYVSVVLVNVAMATDYTLSTFSDGATDSNVTFSNETLQVNKTLQIPINSTINEFRIDFTGYKDYYLGNYTETANSFVINENNITFNYSNVGYSAEGLEWKVKWGLYSYTTYYDLPAICENRSSVQVRFGSSTDYSQYGYYGAMLWCYNGTSYQVVANGNTGTSYLPCIGYGYSQGNATMYDANYSSMAWYCREGGYWYDYDSAGETHSRSKFRLYEESMYWNFSSYAGNLSIYVNNTLVYNNATDFNGSDLNIDLNATTLELCNDFLTSCPVRFESNQTGILNYLDLFINYTKNNTANFFINESLWSTSLFSDEIISKYVQVNNTGDYNATNCTLELSSVLNNYLTYSPKFNISTLAPVDLMLTITNPPAAVYDEYLDVYCTNATSESGEVHTNTDLRVQLVSVTRPADPGTSGGSSGTPDLPECNISVDPESVKVSTAFKNYKITVANYGDETWTPSIGFTGGGGVSDGLSITNPVGSLLAGSEVEFGVRYDPGLADDLNTGSADLIFRSSNCADVELPVTIDLNAESGFLDFLFENGWDLLGLAKEPVLNGEEVREKTGYFNVGLVFVIFFLSLSGLAWKSILKSYNAKSFSGYSLVAVWFGFIIIVDLILTVFIVTGVRVVF